MTFFHKKISAYNFYFQQFSFSLSYSRYKLVPFYRQKQKLGLFLNFKCLIQTLNYLCFLSLFYAVVKVLTSLERPAIYNVFFLNLSIELEQHYQLLISFNFVAYVDSIVYLLIQKFSGGGKRTRTADILLAKQALYQLSYTPKHFINESGPSWTRTRDLTLIRGAL